MLELQKRNAEDSALLSAYFQIITIVMKLPKFVTLRHYQITNILFDGVPPIKWLCNHKAEVLREM